MRFRKGGRSSGVWHEDLEMEHWPYTADGLRWEARIGEGTRRVSDIEVEFEAGDRVQVDAHALAAGAERRADFEEELRGDLVVDFFGAAQAPTPVAIVHQVANVEERRLWRDRHVERGGEAEPHF